MRNRLATRHIGGSCRHPRPDTSAVPSREARVGRAAHGCRLQYCPSVAADGCSGVGPMKPICSHPRKPAAETRTSSRRSFTSFSAKMRIFLTSSRRVHWMGCGSGTSSIRRRNGSVRASRRSLDTRTTKSQTRPSGGSRTSFRKTSPWSRRTSGGIAPIPAILTTRSCASATRTGRRSGSAAVAWLYAMTRANPSACWAGTPT